LIKECEPVRECAEGEEAYFQAHPNVALKWKPRSAYHHWKRYGKAARRKYICKFLERNTNKYKYPNTGKSVVWTYPRIPENMDFYKKGSNAVSSNLLWLSISLPGNESKSTSHQLESP